MNQPQNQKNADPQKEMDLELIRISRYHSIIISKNIGSILLIIYLVTAIPLQKDSVPAFYILAANNFLPFLFTLVLKEEKKKEAQPLLPLFSKKYKYTYLKYRCSSYSIFFVFLLLFLWQKRALRQISSLHLLSITPVIILLTMFLIRTLGNVIYRKKFDQMLMDSNY